MSKRQILMVLGVWIMILCMPGFPNSIKQILGVVTGLLIIFIAYKMRSESLSGDASNSAGSSLSDMPFVENRHE